MSEQAKAEIQRLKAALEKLPPDIGKRVMERATDIADGMREGYQAAQAQQHQKEE